VRQPRAGLAPVHAERLEPLPHVAGEPGRAADLILADEHPDAPGLAVAHRSERRPVRPSRAPAQLVEDPRHVDSGPRAEEDERDVEVLGRDDADVRDATERARLPVDEPLARLGRDRESDEEAKSRIAFQARGRRRARQ
jgi:hypothetical protein